FLGSAVIATVALLEIVGAEHDAAGAGADGAGAAGLLAGLAAGTTTAALAVPFATMPGVGAAPTVRLVPAPADDAGGYRLTGLVAGVADALPADVLLVPVDGVPFGLYAVQAGSAGVDVTGVTSLDMTRQLADVRLDAAAGRRIAAGAAA